MGRVLKENFEKFSEYEYFTGYDKDQPVWVKGIEGLNAIKNDNSVTAESYIDNSFVCEPGVMYNPYLKKFVLTYMRGGSGHIMCTSEKPYGPFGDPIVMFNQSLYPIELFAGLKSGYGTFGHEMLSKDNGKTFWIILSCWKPIYNTYTLEIRLK